mmetsp:Transcript_7531/g.966  ORF Transcript_7531/g.966 Transcript_7531/m.966 type:complete len:88 (+) Transcript_7531:268-531(+)
MESYLGPEETKDTTIYQPYSWYKDNAMDFKEADIFLIIILLLICFVIISSNFIDYFPYISYSSKNNVFIKICSIYKNIKFLKKVRKI